MGSRDHSSVLVGTWLLVSAARAPAEAPAAVNTFSAASASFSHFLRPQGPR